MKGKPVFKNVTKGRIQIIRQGIPLWLDVGDVVAGEKYRAFLSLGLKEVGREGLPKPLAPPTTPPVEAPALVVDDDKPEASPIQVRKIDLVDDVIPIDVIKTGGTTDSLLPEAQEKQEDDQEELEEAPEEPIDEEPSPEPEEEFTSEGDTLKAEIMAELEADMEAEFGAAENLSDSSLPFVILDDEETAETAEAPEEEVVTHPFVCEQCARGFASKRGLKSHLRHHKK